MFTVGILFGLGSHCQLIGLCIVTHFGLCGRDVPDRLEETAVVESVDPFESCELHRLHGAPQPAPTDHLGLEQADDCLGEGVGIGIANAADRRFDVRRFPAGRDRQSGPARKEQAHHPDARDRRRDILRRAACRRDRLRRRARAEPGDRRCGALADGGTTSGHHCGRAQISGANSAMPAGSLPPSRGPARPAASLFRV